jgi:glyoxylase-like metal-dependent hydrolase (beta-lactamase superfamily II)
MNPAWMLDPETLALSVSGFLLRTPEHCILVDTCTGNWRLPGMEVGEQQDSPFLRQLAEAGCTPDDIDVVACTHVHFDHTGWHTRLVGEEVVPTFPRARYLVVDEEWRNAMNTINPGQAYLTTLDRTVKPLVEQGQAELVPADYRVSDEVRLRPMPGHTPGHVAIEVRSRGESAVVTGDLAHHPIQLAEPGWSSVYDGDAAGAGETRGRFVSDCLREGTIVLGTHFPDAGAGRLDRDGTTVRYQTV